MKWILVVAAGLAAIVLVVVIVGAMLPRDHVARSAARIAAPPDAVWGALTDPSAFPTWRADVQRVELLPSTATGASWREHAGNGTITYVVDAAEAPRRLVTRIADRGLPFGGSWEYRIEPDGPPGGASRVVITERGSVYNPVFRFVSRFVMGHTATMDAALRSLGRKFGGDVVVEHPTNG